MNSFAPYPMGYIAPNSRYADSGDSPVTMSLSQSMFGGMAVASRVVKMIRAEELIETSPAVICKRSAGCACKRASALSMESNAVEDSRCRHISCMPTSRESPRASEIRERKVWYAIVDESTSWNERKSRGWNVAAIRASWKTALQMLVFPMPAVPIRARSFSFKRLSAASFTTASLPKNRRGFGGKIAEIAGCVGFSEGRDPTCIGSNYSETMSEIMTTTGEWENRIRTLTNLQIAMTLIWPTIPNSDWEED